MATADQTEGQKIIDTAAKYGLPRYVGWQLAFQLLQDWTAADVTRILDQIDGIDDGFDSLKTVHRDRSLINPKSWQWVKPPWDLMQQAAKEKKALCVNRKGDFVLLQHGFYAISHAGVEGLYEDPNNRGLPRSVLEEVFDLTSSLNPEWLWIDSLSIPAGRRDLNAAEERLKNELINMMAHIYGRADSVIALDACVMHLNSEEPLAVAVALLCGRWSRRMWTYQEGALAKSITIMTKTGSIKLQELTETIKQVDGSKDVSEIIRTLETMTRRQHSPGLYEIAATFFSRQAGLFVDYARALFPILDLVWDERFSRDRAMTVIYESHRHEATKLVCSFGPPRLIDGPGWAPATLSGLRIHPITDASWNGQGLQSSWYIYKIRSVGRHETNKLSLRLEFDEGSTMEFSCWAFSTNDERETSRQGFVDSVLAGQGVLLAPEPLEPMRYLKFLGKYRIVLLAASMPQAEDAMFQVYLTAQIFWLEKIGSAGEKTSLILSHESPLYKPSADERSVKMAVRALTTDINLAPLHGSPLHEAVKQSDLNRLNSLVKDRGNKFLDLDERDSWGWTPLHWAVVSRGVNSFQMTEFLIAQGASVDSDMEDVKSPLLLALEFASDKVVDLLLQKVVSLKANNGVTPLAQAIWAGRRLKTLETLMSRGASVNEAIHGYPLLWLAQSHSLQAFLLEKGADPSARSPYGETRVHRAALKDDTDAANLLVSYGAAVDVLEKGTGRTPLFYAVDEQNVSVVKALLKLQANANFRTKEGWPVLVAAAGGVSMDIVQALLSAGAKADVYTTEELWTPLHNAVRKGRFANLNLLLEQPDSRFTVWRKDKDGMTPRDLALKLPKDDMAVLLERRMKKSDPEPTSATASTAVITVGWFTVALIGMFQYSACAPSKLNEETTPTYWSRFLFSTDLLALKVAFGMVALGGIVVVRESATFGRMSVQESLNQAWRNQPDSSSNTQLGSGLLLLYALLVWQFGSPLRSYIGIAVLTLLMCFIIGVGVSSQQERSNMVSLSAYVWSVAMLPILIDYVGLEAILMPILAGLPSYIAVLLVVNDGERTQQAQDALVASRIGIALVLISWVVISSSLLLLGWELLAITTVLMSNVYFGVLLLQALTHRQYDIEFIGVRGFFLGSCAISIVLTYLYADMVLDIGCLLCLAITARDSRIILTNFALHKSQKERKGRELQYELCLVAASLARTIDMLSRMFGIAMTPAYLVLLTVFCILLWSRRSAERAPRGAKAAPYLLMISVAWFCGAIVAEWVTLTIRLSLVAVLGHVTLFAVLTWFKLGETSIKKT